MPRCISSTSPEERSASRYLARRPRPVTHSPLRGACWQNSAETESAGRAGVLLDAHETQRRPSPAASPRRTVSTSGKLGHLFGSPCQAAVSVRSLPNVMRLLNGVDHGQLPSCPTPAAAGRDGYNDISSQSAHAARPWRRRSYRHKTMRAGRAVAVILAQVKGNPAARDLHVDRGSRLETMLPHGLEAEEIEVELARLRARRCARSGTTRSKEIVIAMGPRPR